MFKLNKKYKICRKHYEDVFGHVLLTKTKSLQVSFFLVKLNKKKVFKPFLFIITKQVRDIFKPRLSRYGKLVNFRKKLSFFYGGLRKKSLKKILFLTLKKNKSNFLNYFVSFLELGLVSVVFRMNFCKTINEAMSLILNGYICVNKEIIKQTRFQLKPGDIIELVPFMRYYYYKRFLYKLDLKEFYVLDNKYLLMNYENLICIIYKYPDNSEVQYPFILSGSKTIGSFLERK